MLVEAESDLKSEVRNEGEENVSPPLSSLSTQISFIPKQIDHRIIVRSTRYPACLLSGGTRRTPRLKMKR